MQRAILVSSLLAVVCMGATPVAQATVADDLCPPAADPCVVNAKVTIDAGSTLDFGPRTLQIAKKGVLNWSTDLTITAGTCDFQAKSKVLEVMGSPGTGYLIMNCSSSTLAGVIRTRGAGVLVEGPGPHALSGVIVAVGDQVGVVAVDSAGMPGGITLSGKIRARSKIGTPPGEFRLISDFGDIMIAETGRIRMEGATAAPFTEFFIVEAGSGKLTVLGKITARATVGAYAMNFEADSDVVFGPKSVVNGGATGTGAEIGINSQGGRVAVQGHITAPVSMVTSGNGARLRLCASGDILIDGGAVLDASDRKSDGSVIVGSGGTVQIGTVLKGAKVFAKKDGDIEICAAGGVTVATPSVIKPAPEAIGTNVCLSPESQFIFDLDCNQ